MNEEYVRKYTDLIREFVRGDATAAEFSTKYMNEFLADDEIPDDEVFKPLDYLFAEADAYCEPELRDDVIGGIGEAELEASATEVLEELNELLDENDR